MILAVMYNGHVYPILDGYGHVQDMSKIYVRIFVL